MSRGRSGAILVAVALAVAACSGADGSEPESTVPVAPSSTPEQPLVTAEVITTSATTTIPVFADGPIEEVCGETIVVQTTDLPNVGVGPLYGLLGASPSIDVDRQAVTAPLTRADGTIEATMLEIRSGGPGVGFRSPVAVMADDDAVHLAVASTAVALRDRSLLETQAVATLTERSTDALIIDPATHADVTDLSSLVDRSIEVRHVTDAPVISFLVASDALDPDQLVAGSDGLPASFVEAEGQVAQQGDLVIEPALLPALEQWGRPVAALPASEAGWRSLDDMVLVDAENGRVSDDCLGRLVRVLQESIVAYVADPAAINALMSGIRAEFNPLSRLTPALFDTGTRLAIDAGVFDTQAEGAPGTIATEGLDVFLAELGSALDVEPVATDQLVDLTYIDSTISR